MHVDEAGENVGAAGVDDAGSGGDCDRALRTDGGDAVAEHEHDLVAQHALGVHGDDRSVEDGEGGRGGFRRRREEEERDRRRQAYDPRDASDLAHADSIVGAATGVIGKTLEPECV